MEVGVRHNKPHRHGDQGRDLCKPAQNAVGRRVEKVLPGFCVLSCFERSEGHHLNQGSHTEPDAQVSGLITACAASWVP